MPFKNTLFRNLPLALDALPTLSTEFDIPVSTLEEVLAQFDSFGKHQAEFYDEATNVKINAFVACLTQTAEEEIEAEDEVVVHAANSLMAVMADPLNGHFIIEDGICHINKENPPDLAHSYQVVDNVFRLGELGDKINDSACWMLGSIVCELEDYFGEAFNISQVTKQTKEAYNTVWTAGRVFREYHKRRVGKLPFTSYKEAMFTKIPESSKDLILHKAATYKLGCKMVRELGSIVKGLEDDTPVKNIRSKKQAEDLINAHKEAKIKYLVLDNNQMNEFNGDSTTIPVGKLVIDLRNKTWRKDGGQPIPIKKAPRKIIRN